MIEEFAKLVPPEIMDRSGSVFYSGRAAFGSPNDLYLIGVNPGGNPVGQADETVARHMGKVLAGREAWSEYLDESWKGAPPGTFGMQPRVLHMLRRLSLDPRTTPASNLVFLRSSRESGIDGTEMKWLAQLCWPVHQAVLEKLRPRVIVCFGRTAGAYVRSRLGADLPVLDFVENNARRWRSTAHANQMGVTVVTVTHPSIADWTSPAADPTSLVQSMLSR
jgi:hypothetical protein